MANYLLNAHYLQHYQQTSSRRKRLPVSFLRFNGKVQLFTYNSINGPPYAIDADCIFSELRTGLLQIV